MEVGDGGGTSNQRSGQAGDGDDYRAKRTRLSSNHSSDGAAGTSNTSEGRISPSAVLGDSPDPDRQRVGEHRLKEGGDDGAYSTAFGAGPTPIASPARSAQPATEKPPSIPQRRNSLRNTKALTIMTPTVADLANQVTVSSQGPGLAPPHVRTQLASPVSHQPTGQSHQFLAPRPPSHHQSAAPLSHYQTSTYNPSQSPRAQSLPFAKPLPMPKTPDVVRYSGVGTASPPAPSFRHVGGPHDMAPSPRAEFPSRELPLPSVNQFSSGDPPRSPHPLGFTYTKFGSNAPPPSPSSAHPLSREPGSSYSNPATQPPQPQSNNGPQSLTPPIPAAGNSSTPAGGRAAFFAPFESLYEVATEEVPRLTASLRDQLRKSTSLLQTLQASGQMIEALVSACFRDMQNQYGEKFGAALSDLNRRLEVLEERLGVTGGGATGPSYVQHLQQQQQQPPVHYGFRGSPPTPIVAQAGSRGVFSGNAADDSIVKLLVDRIEALEKKIPS
ncbi:hypothetical protein DFJ73DRAFT_268975 [Zopfochytrium polystomum]|nr:hypothetical protein DFJ73DRAFT_268975 [Zopfochytrium polystomum]